MKTWNYTAVDASGSKVKGRLRAISEVDAMSQLVARSLSPLSVEELKADSGFLRHMKSSEVEQLTTELGILLRNGVQLDRALEMMAESNPNASASAMLTIMTEDVRSGTSLHKSFSKFTRYFDTLFCEMVRIGEESGQLAPTLERLAYNMKFQNELKNKITQAMVYPGFILAVCIVAMFAIFNFIVPSMSGLFTNMQDIPAYTAFLINSSAWVQRNQFIMLAVLAILFLLIISSWRKPWFQDLVFSILRSTPVLKHGLLLSERIRFMSAMQLMLTSGLPLSQALGFSVGVVQDPKIKKQLMRVRDEVSQGRMLSESLSSTDTLEAVMLSLVRVGEESGRLDSIFTEMTQRARWRFEQWALKLTSMLEPILIIVMGGMVGSVVITMLLSIVSTSDVPF